MGEDQHAARLRGLDEAERRNRLAGAGRVLEPEALGGVGVLGLLAERLLLAILLDPVAGLLLGVALLLELILLVVDLLLELVLILVVLVVVLVGSRPLDGTELVVVLVVLVELIVVLVLVPFFLITRIGLRIGGAARDDWLPLVVAPSGPRMSAEASSSGEADAAARPFPVGSCAAVPRRAAP